MPKQAADQTEAQAQAQTRSQPPGPWAAWRGWGLSWGGWLDNRHGEWWLLAQLLLIGLHLLPPWPAPGSWGYAWPLPLAIVGVSLLLVGLALGRREAVGREREARHFKSRRIFKAFLALLEFFQRLLERVFFPFVVLIVDGHFKNLFTTKGTKFTKANSSFILYSSPPPRA